jgi:hypothetical protein
MIINKVVMDGGKEIDLEKLARKKLMKPEEYTQEFPRYTIPVTHHMHQVKGLGTIHVTFELVLDKETAEPSTWRFIHAFTKKELKIRPSIQKRAERNAELREKGMRT